MYKQGNSKEATARKFGVDSKRIREWCKQEDKLQAAKTGGNVSTPTKQRKRLDGGGRKPLSETLETELYQWIEEKRYIIDFSISIIHVDCVKALLLCSYDVWKGLVYCDCVLMNVWIWWHENRKSIKKIYDKP